MSDLFSNNNKTVCKNCGMENITGAKFCMSCGAQMEIEPPKQTVQAEEVISTPWTDANSNPYFSSSANPYDNSSQQSYQEPEMVNPNANSNGLSIASMICGIIALICCYLAIPLAIAALVTGIIALSKKYGGKGMAIAGIVTSALAIIINIILFILLVVLSSSEWAPFYY